MIGTCPSSGSGTSSMSGFGPGRSATTRCALYDGIRSTRHCGRQSLSHAQTRWVGPVVGDQPADEVEEPAHGVHRRPVRRPAPRARRRRPGSTSTRSRAPSAALSATGREPARIPSSRALGSPAWRTPTAPIVDLLAADGRMSFTDLGKATGLSTSAVHQRVKRLEKRGLITGYGASIDHEELGLPLTAFVSITPIDPSQPDDYPERLRGIAEIESCWSVAGDESYILKVRVETRRARGPAGPDPVRGQRLHPHHDRAQHAVREPPGHLAPRVEPADVPTPGPRASFAVVEQLRGVLQSGARRRSSRSAVRRAGRSPRPPGGPA